MEEAIRYDELVLDTSSAIEKLRQMAAIEGRLGWEQTGSYLFQQAGEHYERGDQKGENTALLLAIAAYRAALEERTRERVPLDWAATQNNLGTALCALGSARAARRVFKRRLPPIAPRWKKERASACRSTGR